MLFLGKTLAPLGIHSASYLRIGCLKTSTEQPITEGRLNKMFDCTQLPRLIKVCKLYKDTIGLHVNSVHKLLLI